MRKTVNIDGRDVKLVSHGATPIYYKQEFGSDFFADMLTMIKSLEGLVGSEKSNELDLSKLTYEDLNHLDLTLFYQMMYILAKGGNKDIDNMYEWLASFDEFPMLDFIGDIIELLGGLLSRKKPTTMSTHPARS